MLLGLGTGVPEFLEAFHSTDASKMVGRMSEYIDVLRLSWQYLRTGEAEPMEGEYYQFVPPPINPWGVRGIEQRVDPDLPRGDAAAAPGPGRPEGRRLDRATWRPRTSSSRR